MTFVHASLLTMTAALVFALGWRLGRAQSPLFGGVFALLLFVLHPLVLSGAVAISAWDGFFSALFFLAWSWMEEWSLFMRSWILAGLFAFGLWMGSSLVFWIPMAMLPWVVFSRRPMDALVKFLTIVLGGLFLFGLLWGGSLLFSSDQPTMRWMHWIRWSAPHLPIGLSWFWGILLLDAVGERILEAIQTRRSDASCCLAALLVLLLFFGLPEVNLAIVSLACPLIALTLSRREFLFQRTVRWIAAISFVLTLGIVIYTRQAPSLVWTAVILAVGIGVRAVRRTVPLSGRAALEAACVGAYFAEAIGTVLWR